jgi:hypothetical protein
MTGIKPNTWNDSSVMLPEDYNDLKDFIVIAYTRDDTVPGNEIIFNLRKKLKEGQIYLTRAINSNRETNKWHLECVGPNINLLIDNISQLGVKVVKWMWVSLETEEGV